MSHDELLELVTRIRALATSAPTLTAKLKVDGENLNPKSKTSMAARRRALLEEL